MPITAAQREARKKHIGGSDVAAILGLDPFKNAYDVFVEKTRELDPIKETQPIQIGNYLEDGLLSYAEHQLGKVRRNQYRSRPDLYLGVNIDAIVEQAGEPVEAKAAGMVGPTSEEWGEVLTDEVPEKYLIQGHAAMMALSTKDGLGPEVCHFPVLLGWRGLCMFRIERDDVICSAIAEACVAFWEQHVLAGIPPEGISPTPDVMRRVRRVPSSVTNLEYATWDRHRDRKAALKDAELQCLRAEGDLLAALGDAEAGDMGDMGMVTFLEEIREYIDAKRLKVDHPDIYKQYAKKTTFRRLRYRKPKTA